MTQREHQTRAELMWAMLVVFATTIMREPIVCLSWKRTVEEQRLLVARGASKTMNSAHLKGLARDYAFINDIKDNGKIDWSPDAYRPLGEFWELLGGKWGGRFGDDPDTEKIEGWDAGHFEYIEKEA